ncbi:MAG: hypothetical protein JW747_01265 [Candidatus Aminicenantes bacterium]|nr:hypothetical protein [Candidatus Aminicenantes bacterium]
MNEDSWKERLRNVLGDFDLLEKCKRDTLDNFQQFCEFIAEPAFESLRLEFRRHRIKTSYGRLKKRAVYFRVNFRRSRADNFYYVLILPANAVEMRLRLLLRGRRAPHAALEDREEAFLPLLAPSEVMKIDREALILDVITRYQEFNYRARTSPC